MQLIGLIFIKGHKNESQEKVKKKFDIGVVLWVKHVVLWVYWDEISENLTWSVTECMFVGWEKWEKEEVNKQ